MSETSAAAAQQRSVKEALESCHAEMLAVIENRSEKLGMKNTTNLEASTSEKLYIRAGLYWHKKELYPKSLYNNDIEDIYLKYLKEHENLLEFKKTVRDFLFTKGLNKDHYMNPHQFVNVVDLETPPKPCPKSDLKEQSKKPKPAILAGLKRLFKTS